MVVEYNRQPVQAAVALEQRLSSEHCAQTALRFTAKFGDFDPQISIETGTTKVSGTDGTAA